MSVWVLIEARGGARVTECNKGPVCGSLNVVGPQDLIGRGTIRRRGFFGVGAPCWRKHAMVGTGF